jgi:hypothetical protein
MEDTTARPDLKVLIVGAGIGGVMLALLLEKIGIDYTILERAKVVKPLGMLFVIGRKISHRDRPSAHPQGNLLSERDRQLILVFTCFMDMYRFDDGCYSKHHARLGATGAVGRAQGCLQGMHRHCDLQS